MKDGAFEPFRQKLLVMRSKLQELADSLKESGKIVALE